jgi:hypothetical protein
VPVGGGVRGPFGDGPRVPPVRRGAGRGAGEGAGVGREFGVDGGPVRRGQARGFAHEEGGAPFVELAGFEGGEGVRHFGHEGFGQAQEPAALRGGFAPGQGDLCSDPGAELFGGHPGAGLLTPVERIKGHGQTCLTCSQGRLLVFQAPDFSNQTRTVQLRYVGANGDAFIFCRQARRATKGAVAPYCCRG